MTLIFQLSFSTVTRLASRTSWNEFRTLASLTLSSYYRSVSSPSRASKYSTETKLKGAFMSLSAIANQVSLYKLVSLSCAALSLLFRARSNLFSDSNYSQPCIISLIRAECSLYECKSIFKFTPLAVPAPPIFFASPLMEVVERCNLAIILVF